VKESGDEPLTLQEAEEIGFTPGPYYVKSSED